MNKYFWIKEHNQYILDYKNNIINKTQLISIFKDVIDIIIKDNINKLNYKYDYDMHQECFLNIFESVIDKIDKERIITAQKYITKSIREYLINYKYMYSNDYYRQNYQYNLVKKEEITEDNMLTYNYVDHYINTIDNRIIILNEIDNRIKKMRILNSGCVLYLYLLKEYLIENNFNSYGFKKYCLNKMNISYETFLIYSHRINISIIYFKDEE